MKKRKICFVSDTWFPILGGGTQVLYHYAKLLSLDYNYEVDIITRPLFSKSNTRINKKQPFRVIYLGKKSRWNDSISRIIFIKNVFIYLLTHTYDLIHAFPFISGIPCIFAGLLKRKPVVYSFFSFSGYQYIDFKKFIYIIIEKALFFLPYTLVLTDNITIHRKFKKNKYLHVSFLPNGVDKELFERVKNIKKKRQILFVGRFHKQKGVSVLLESFLHIQKRVKNIMLVLIGEGAERNSIKNYIKKYKLTNSIIIKAPKYSSELIKEYKRSMFLILPSLFEGQGIVVFEAWMAKIPVIASKTGSLTKYIKQGENGFLVEVGDTKELTNKAIDLIKNRKLRNKMGLEGYKLVSRYFTWDKTLSKLNKYYNTILLND